ncbi:hypothetical protein EHF33_01270 [Deinococcus psychrotolerans]|uniref:Lipoprotein n=1 Tax=Deinococcus psychrotolerans TaxID=2489213 RepID=A0A3G8YG79_9DEIO|nr:hypothetical protein [Deinococcus psychrotolerans]AZI41554.1 hypothetical protein EHF33_01270 [Deinococcus psychrotolerans]
MKRLLSVTLIFTLVSCAPRLSSGPPALNCTGTRSGTLTQVTFKLSANIDPQTSEIAGVLTEAGDKSFWVYGRRVADGSNFNLILNVSDHTESYAGVDLIFKKARLGYFSNSQSTLSGVLSGQQFVGRQKAGVNNYEVLMTCRLS